MIVFLGKFSLYAALLFSLLQSVLPLYGYLRNNPYALAFARPSAWGQFLFVISAYALLTIAFGINDFSIAYVAQNSHPMLPLIYRLTAVWGAHEGSILLWIAMLNGWTIFFLLIYKICYQEKIFLALVLSILGLISFCLLCFLLFTSNPFLLSAVNLTGQDLNPLLQDPGFIIHPPILYLGYAGFSAAFAITQAALICQKLNEHWAQMTRQFAILAWGFLSLGITLGSWWAYRVLGWGGFWFWDPVENASLLPWLSGIALIHVLVLAEKRGMAKAWAVWLALISFALSLLGTFLVRSGILISAHTFANDPARGLFLLLLFAVVITAALILYTLRIPRLVSKPPAFSLLSREALLLINSAFLFAAMLIILLGTLYPLILNALQLGTISVGPPYFNKVLMPLVFVMMGLMGIAPFCRFQEGSIKKLWMQTWKNMLGSLLIAGIVLFCVTSEMNFLSFLSLSLCIWVLLSVRGSFRLHSGMSLAHAGFAVLLIGIMLSSLLTEEKEIRIHPGQAETLGPYQFFFLDTERMDGPNFRGIRGLFEVIKNKQHVTYLFPEKRLYTVREMVMTKVDIHPGIFRDLYIALGEPLAGNDWSVRLYYKPFVRWIWFGGMLMMIGGVLTVITGFKKRGLSYDCPS